MRTLLFILCCGLLLQCQAQVDTFTTLKTIEAKLKSKEKNVSDILKDKDYNPLHPLTEFRKLIEKYCSAGELRITSDDEPGKRIKVIGIVKDRNGKPVADALIYLYQTDTRGWYSSNSVHVGGNEGDYRHARLFGYVKTDKNGQFELETIKPNGYPQSDLAAHIHVHVNKTGYLGFATEFLFDDDDRLKGEIRERYVLQKAVIAKPEAATAPFVQKFQYIMTLEY